MANPLYNALGGNKPYNNNLAGFIAEVKNLQKTFQGNPQAEVQKLMNTGRLSQAQFNQYAQMANQIMSAMSGKI